MFSVNLLGFQIKRKRFLYIRIIRFCLIVCLNHFCFSDFTRRRKLYMVRRANTFANYPSQTNHFIFIGFFQASFDINEIKLWLLAIPLCFFFLFVIESESATNNWDHIIHKFCISFTIGQSIWPKLFIKINKSNPNFVAIIWNISCSLLLF